jgi:DNA-binding CsgD family transcriptional regulator
MKCTDSLQRSRDGDLPTQATSFVSQPEDMAEIRRLLAVALRRAVTLRQESLQARRGPHELLGIVNLLELLALYAAGQHDYRRAATLLGAASRIWPSIGSQLSGPGYVSAPHSECETLARNALGPRGYSLAFHHGVGLSLDQTVCYVLGADQHFASASTAQAATQDRFPTRRSSPLALHESPLTHREHQVAQLVAQGLTNRQIAEHLVVACRTVDAHLEHIRYKLGLTRRAQIAAWVTAHCPAPTPST